MSADTVQRGTYQSIAVSLRDGRYRAALKLGVPSYYVGELSLDDLRAGIAGALKSRDKSGHFLIRWLSLAWNSLTIAHFNAFVAAYMRDGAPYGATANGLLRWHEEHH